jgi:hypothetical protein
VSFVSQKEIRLEQQVVGLEHLDAEVDDEVAIDVAFDEAAVAAAKRESENEIFGD